jgi:hypothetical protein
VGGHGEEVTNNNGERLIQICECFSLKLWMVITATRTFINTLEHKTPDSSDQ